MKNHAIIPAILGLAFGSLNAQTVPYLINYQGSVTDGNNIPLGATGTPPNLAAAPVNRKVIFRIYDDPTATAAENRLWSEQQTVTISLGEFSVLLGQGTVAVYDSAPEARPGLDTVFTGGGAVLPEGPLRYLEIVMDDGNGTFTADDKPITPRQRITSTAYSLRAGSADTVAASAINSDALASGSVTGFKIADSAITTEKIANLSILTEDLANNSITSDKIANLSVGTADLADQAVTAGKLDTNIALGLWQPIGELKLNVVRHIGFVGIGKEPVVPLDVAGTIAATGNITAVGDITSGGRITATGGITSAGAVTASSITTTGPFAATNVTANGAMRARGGAPGGGGGNNNGFAFTGNGGDNDSGMFSSSDGQVEFYTNSVERMRIQNANVGIGTTSPTVPLDVAGNTRITMIDNGYISGQGDWVGNTNTYNLVDTPPRPGGEGPELYGMSGTHGSTGPRFLNNQNARYSGSVAIRASGGYIASSMGLIVYSDRRIKRDAKDSVIAKDLATIQKLRVTDYRMVDPADGGTAWRKGFIAQEVEKVIPGAVTRSVEFVPDIFSLATAVVFDPAARTLAVTLGKDHDLKAGERVRLHIDGSRVDLDVSAAPSAREFVVDKCERSPEKVFVYGRQVNDFRTVDYDRIFITSIGALQELKREKDAEVKALQEENASLRARIAALEANDKTRDARLAAIESLLVAKDKSATRIVSLKTDE